MVFIGGLIGVLVVFMDVLLKGFLLCGLLVIIFGLGVGMLILYFVGMFLLFVGVDL